jgi:hypothetical protein
MEVAPDGHKYRDQGLAARLGRNAQAKGEKQSTD